MIEFLVLGLACAVVLMLWKSVMSYLALGSLALAQLGAKPDVAIVIPACNEAHRIARIVRSFPNLPVMVVDDGSTDATSHAARRGGAQVIGAPPLSPNANGKANACAEGARHVTSKWILFVDAGTWFAPEFAASLVAYAEANRVQWRRCFLNSTAKR